ncbi:hypothetical protein ACLMJK_008544 [Lecanora helva]
MEGYAKFANFMGEHPESALFLRFSDINLQNILYLQAEIYGLREDLRRIELQNQASSAEDLTNFHLDWSTLAQTQENGQANQQWRKVKQLRELLKEYSENNLPSLGDNSSEQTKYDAVLQFHEMSKLSSPKPRELHKLQEWLSRPSLGSVYLTGRDRNIWSDGVDLVSLGKSPPKNQLTSLIAEFLVPTYHKVFRRYFMRIKANSSKPGSSIVEYSDNGITQIADFVGTVLASIIPVLAIVVLYLVNGMGIRLGLVAVFSAVFSMCLWFLNEGSLVDVFSATSA